MIVQTPPAIPVTTPDVAFTVAMALSLLLQEPPLTPLVSVNVPPTHAVGVPVVAPGTGSVIELQLPTAPATKLDEEPVSAKLLSAPQMPLPL